MSHTLFHFHFFTCAVPSVCSTLPSTLQPTPNHASSLSLNIISFGNHCGFPRSGCFPLIQSCSIYDLPFKAHVPSVITYLPPVLLPTCKLPEGSEISYLVHHCTPSTYYAWCIVGPQRCLSRKCYKVRLLGIFLIFFILKSLHTYRKVSRIPNTLVYHLPRFIYC